MSRELNNLPTLYDFSITGGFDRNGEFRQVWAEEALENSLKMWLTSKPNETLRRPNTGGFLYPVLGKPMNEDTATEIRLAIRNGIKLNFRPFLVLKRIEVEPVVDARVKYWKIYLEVEAEQQNFKITIDERIKARV